MFRKIFDIRVQVRRRNATDLLLLLSFNDQKTTNKYFNDFGPGYNFPVYLLKMNKFYNFIF